MPSKKPMVTLRTDQDIIKKLKYIADFENRSDNKQLEYILKEYINHFENEHGEIDITKTTEN